MPKAKAKNDTAARALQDLGLSENAAVLYAHMLNHPRSTVHELAPFAPFPRTMLYYVLKQLMRHGLVSPKKDGWRTIYIAESPDRLYDLLAQKERSFTKDVDAVRKLIPHLKNKYRLAGKRPDVRVFDGMEEYAQALEDSIASKSSEILSYEMLLESQPALEIREAYERRRTNRKIPKKVLFFESASALRTLAKRPYNDLTEYRSIAKDLVPFSTDVMLYDGKLLYTSYYDKQEPVAVLIEDEGLYLMQKNMFDMLWKKGTDHTLDFTKKKR